VNQIDKLEVRNETDKEIWVRLCHTPLGGYYLHVSDKEDGHINIPVRPNDYEQIEPKEFKV
jgi:hypothetical protein